MSSSTDPAPAAGRRYRALLLLCLLLGLVVRLVVELDLAASDPTFRNPRLDADVYLEWAGRIAGGDVLGNDPYILSPLYGYFLAPVVGIAGPEPILPIRLLQGLMGLATVLLVAGATRRLLDERHALVAALLAALFAPLIFYEHLVMVCTLAVFANALALAALARLPERPSLRRGLVAGLPLGLALLARPNIGLFCLAIPLWLLAFAPPGRRLSFLVSRTAAIAAGAFLVVLPVTIRNLVVTDDLVLVTPTGGMNLYQCNNPAARFTGYMESAELHGHPVRMNDEARCIAEEAEGRELKPSEVSRHWARTTLKAMAAEPGAAAVFLLRKAFLFLDGREIQSSYSFEEQRSETTFFRLLPVTWTLLMPLALLGLFRSLRRRGPPLVFGIMFLSLAAGLVVFYRLGHYRVPLLPAAAPLAAGGLLLLLERLRTPGRRAAALAGLVLAVLVTQVPPLAAAAGIDDLRRPRDHRVGFLFARGAHFLQEGEPDLAEREFQKAFRVAPESVQAWLGFALLAEARGDAAGERRFLEKALAISPGDPDVIVLLGMNLFLGGEREEGQRMVEQVVSAHPRSAAARRALADIHLKMDRPIEALRELEAAERLGDLAPEVIANQSLALRWLDRPAEAYRRMSEALERRPGTGLFHLERAWCLRALRPRDRAAIEAEIAAARRAGVAIPEELDR